MIKIRFLKFSLVAIFILIIGTVISGSCARENLNNNNSTQTRSSNTVSINSINAGEDIRVVKKGDIIKVDYTGTLSDGSTFDTSIGRTPLEFTVGAGQMIAGFDKAVVGMKLGETKKVTIPAAEAYGEYQPNLVLVIQRDQLPQGMSPKIGDHLGMRQPNGRSVEVVVTGSDDTSITVDANHALAGKDLTFEITIVDIK
jgi:peptidylprolyl isomerase